MEELNVQLSSKKYETSMQTKSLQWNHRNTNYSDIYDYYNKNFAKIHRLIFQYTICRLEIVVAIILKFIYSIYTI